ncbi:MAG: phenylalanine--tRNA ligase subunit beta [Sulfuricaulis sp.]
MKISEKWLREWISPGLTTRELADRLTMAGLEVGALQPVAPPLDRVVVGEIVAITPHPSADKLRLCRVRVGQGKMLDIVCGAANAAAGMKVAVALEGATLPNGKSIQHTEIRGVASSGMLCSASELGLADVADGLLALPADATPGLSLTDQLDLDDVTLEIDLTPNRGDCLSVAGIARELSALTGAPLKPPVIRTTTTVRQSQKFTVKLEAPQDCPRYAGRIIRDIDPLAQTPWWMKEKLRRSGLRSIHPVVDVTNYVMLELGQPMHAFDLEQLHGAIHVRHAGKNESLILLDGSHVQLEAGSLLIADAQQPLALAGIMGGQASAVSGPTRHLFLESAWFRPETISVRARSLGLQTDSSQRFERGVDPAIQRLALERATALLLNITGGKPGPVVERTMPRYLPRRVAIVLRPDHAERLLGLVVLPKNIASILKRLGMTLKKSGKNWRVTAPSYRFDISREVDLIEEIARIHGYDKLPGRCPRIEMVTRPVPESALSERRARALLIDREYQEVITYSFIDPKIAMLLDPQTPSLPLANPISADMAVMRTTLWPGLLQTIRYNQNRQQTRLRLFEIGRTFLPQAGDIIQEQMVAGAISGDTLAEQWSAAKRQVDFYDIKADIEALLTLAGVNQATRFYPAQHPALHPGQTAEISRDGSRIGLIGPLHPEIQARLGLDQRVILFELRLSGLQRSKALIFQEFSKFPSIRRDIAIIVPETVPAQSIVECVQKAAGKLLVNLELFDEYRGKGIDSGRKSLALGLTLQDSSRTLNEDEIEQVVTQVVSVLRTELGALLRQ